MQAPGSAFLHQDVLGGPLGWQRPDLGTVVEVQPLHVLQLLHHELQEEVQEH